MLAITGRTVAALRDLSLLYCVVATFRPQSTAQTLHSSSSPERIAGMPDALLGKH